MPSQIGPGPHEAGSLPEWRLLLAGARKTLRPVDGEHIAELSDRALDWRLFLRHVARHRVAL